MSNEAPLGHIIRRVEHIGGVTQKTYWRQTANHGAGGWVPRQRHATRYPSRDKCEAAICDDVGLLFTGVASVRLRKRAKPATAPQPEPNKAAPSPLSDLLNAKPAPRPTEPWQSPRPSIQPWYPVVPTRTAPPWTGGDDLWMRPFETWCDDDGLSAGLGFPSGTKLTNDADGNLVATPPGEAPRIVLKAASVPSFSLTDPIAHTPTVSASPSNGSAVTHTQADLDSLLIQPSEPLLRGTVTVSGSFE